MEARESLEIYHLQYILHRIILHILSSLAIISSIYFLNQRKHFDFIKQKFYTFTIINKNKNTTYNFYLIYTVFY